MRELNTIQKCKKLNKVSAMDEPGRYEIDCPISSENGIDTSDVTIIQFQNGERGLPDSVPGVTDTDLLEIVRDHLKGFQHGESACRENACAITHIEEAIMWMNQVQ